MIKVTRCAYKVIDSVLCINIRWLTIICNSRGFKHFLSSTDNCTSMDIIYMCTLRWQRKGESIDNLFYRVFLGQSRLKGYTVTCKVKSRMGHHIKVMEKQNIKYTI